MYVLSISLLHILSFFLSVFSLFLQDAITHTKLGQIYETFGPTTQPFYQVKFSAAFPLDPERVRVGREVFHVPTRSRFVFVNQIKAFKGSDASNVHDEEPADEELEFSDDEAEAAYRSRLKRKCVLNFFLFFFFLATFFSFSKHQFIVQTRRIPCTFRRFLAPIYAQPNHDARPRTRGHRRGYFQSECI
jgi:hypothetical protein